MYAFPCFNILSFLVYDAREDGPIVEEYQDKGASCHGTWKGCEKWSIYPWISYCMN